MSTKLTLPAAPPRIRMVSGLVYVGTGAHLVRVEMGEDVKDWLCWWNFAKAGWVKGHSGRDRILHYEVDVWNPQGAAWLADNF